jgi:hypothetical protein
VFSPPPPVLFSVPGCRQRFISAPVRIGRSVLFGEFGVAPSCWRLRLRHPMALGAVLGFSKLEFDEYREHDEGQENSKKQRVYDQVDQSSHLAAPRKMSAGPAHSARPQWGP